MGNENPPKDSNRNIKKSILIDESVYQLDQVPKEHKNKGREVTNPLKKSSKNKENILINKNVYQPEKVSKKSENQNAGEIGLEDPQQLKKSVRNKRKSIFIDENVYQLDQVSQRPSKENGCQVNRFNVKDIKKKIDNSKNLNTNNKQKTKQKTVNFNLSKLKDQECQRLRHLEPKNYLEESVTDDLPSKAAMQPVQINSEKKFVPIYRQILPEKQENKKQNDLYEFTDSSPIPKNKGKERRPRKSSILFDKTTHEILKRIEEKEAKTKKKVAKKKQVQKPVSKIPYDKIVKGIMSNIKQKIQKQNRATHDNPIGTNSQSNLPQNQKNVPLKGSHNKVMQINNFNEETNIIPQPAEVPCNNEKTKPQVQNIMKVSSKTNNYAVSTRNPIREKTTTEFNTFDKLKRSQNVSKPLPPNSISVLHDDNDNLDSQNYMEKIPDLISENSCIQNDIDSSFGFDNDHVSPVISISNKSIDSSVNILQNVVVNRGQGVQSPFDFNVRRPNANSTMINIEDRNRTSSPWRLNTVTFRRNPHFVSVKTNGLPRIDQDLVLDHTLVEEFESLCSKTPKKAINIPGKKSPVQQSILDFVESNIEKEHEPVVSSLFDYEAFKSPIKRTTKNKENQEVERVKRNLLGNKETIVSSTPLQKRKVLGDISNSSGETILPSSTENNTFFGFDESTLNFPQRTPEKHSNLKENSENDNLAKPMRFDLGGLKSYTSKKGKKNRVADVKKLEQEKNLDQSISIMEVSNQEDCAKELHLFEDPEEILDNMSPVIAKKKHRRQRFDSCDSEDEGEKKRKRYKKTKLEIEQEEWIQDFNQMCAEVDKHELELE